MAFPWVFEPSILMLAQHTLLTHQAILQSHDTPIPHNDSPWNVAWQFSLLIDLILTSPYTVELQYLCNI